MLQNAPVKSIQFGGLTIEGYSRAAVQSYWRIAELKLGFDLGAHPWDFMGTPTWLLSHCHLDHIAALPLYVARRRLMKMTEPRVIVPRYAMSGIRQMLDSFAALDRGKLPCELIGLEPGDRYEISRELVVEACAMSHRVPSLGFVVFDRRRKLLAKYADLSGDQIRNLRESGVEVTREVLMPLVGYTGDTNPRGLDNNPLLYETKILITEMTFLADDHQMQFIHKNGHMHLEDFVERADRFKNELIIVGHFSTRYGRREAEKLIRNRLPTLLDERLCIWL